jgi:hypothetical protein
MNTNNDTREYYADLISTMIRLSEAAQRAQIEARQRAEEEQRARSQALIDHWMRERRARVDLELSAHTEHDARRCATRILCEVCAPHLTEQSAHLLAFKWNLGNDPWGRTVRYMHSTTVAEMVNPRRPVALTWKLLTDEHPEWRAELAQHKAGLTTEIIMERMNCLVVSVFYNWCNLEKYLRNNNV